MFSFVWQWTDSLYTTLFLSGYKILSSALGAIYEKFEVWYTLNIARADVSGLYRPPLLEIQQIIATGTLMFILPLVLLYLVAQKAFVESLSQTGIKM